MRYLFVTWDGGGNLTPELIVARSLVGRGHEVSFLGHESQRGRIEAADCYFRGFSLAPDCDAARSDRVLVPDWEDRPPQEIFALARERFMFGPAAEFARDVLSELDRRPVDAVAIDYLILGALAGVESCGVPGAALWHTPYLPAGVEVRPPEGGAPGAVRVDDRESQRRSMARPSSWWNEGLTSFNAVRQGLGLGPLANVFDQYDRLARVLVLTSPSFDFAALSGASLPDNVRYVGGQARRRPRRAPTARPAQDRPLVLVSLGTTYQAQEELLRRVVDALAPLPVRVVVTTGPAVTLEGSPPSNVEVSRWIPHHEILPDTALVVTHGGMGTVMASLAYGVPLVCIPLGRDQPYNAARVTYSGAGIRLSRSAGLSEITTTIRSALSDGRLAANARRMARALELEMLEDQAALELERIASHAG